MSPIGTLDAMDGEADREEEPDRERDDTVIADEDALALIERAQRSVCPDGPPASLSRYLPPHSLRFPPARAAWPTPITWCAPISRRSTFAL